MSGTLTKTVLQTIIKGHLSTDVLVSGIAQGPFVPEDAFITVMATGVDKEQNEGFLYIGPCKSNSTKSQQPLRVGMAGDNSSHHLSGIAEVAGHGNSDSRILRGSIS